MNSNTSSALPGFIVLNPSYRFKGMTLDLCNDVQVTALRIMVESLLTLHEGHYTRANDSSRNETYIREQEERMANIETTIENIASSLGAKTYWPGLYPAFKYNGYEFLSMESLIKFRSNEARNVMVNAK
jgi:hypothetical protein